MLMRILAVASLLVYTEAHYSVENSSVVSCDNLDGLDVSEKFLSTGNETTGLYVVQHCLELLNVCPDHAGVNITCSFYNKTYEVSKQWSLCREKRQKWLESNEGLDVDKHRRVNSDLDNLGECLQEAFRLVDDIRSYNVGVEVSGTFLWNVTELYHVYRQRELQFQDLLFHVLFVRLPLLVVILVVGLVGNGTMIVIIVQQPEMRTQSNMMLLNLAVVDTLNLLVSLPLVKVFKLLEYLTPTRFDDVSCKAITFVLAVFSGLTVFSVVALSVFRFVAVHNATSSSRQQSARQLKLTSKNRALPHILLVWVLAIVFAVPTAVSFGTTRDGSCNFTNVTMAWMWNLMVHSVVPVVAIVVLYISTAVRMTCSARNIPGEALGLGTHRVARNRSARVLLTLSCVFVVSFVPYNLSVALLFWGVMGVKATILIGDLFCLLYLSSMANPLALMCTSRKFRKYFILYLFRHLKLKSCRRPRSDSQVFILRSVL